MNFDLEDEQEELRDAVRAVLAQECPISLARERYEGDHFPAQPWQSARELGWTALTVPTEFGGLGLGPIELGLLAEEHGYTLAAGPFLPTLSQWIPALVVAGSEEQKKAHLEKAAAGELTGTLAVAGENGETSGRDASLRALPDGGDWRLEGSRHFVMDCGKTKGPVADEIVVVANVDSGDGVALFLVPGASVECERFKNLDASRPLASLRFDGLRVEADRTLGKPGQSAPALRRILDEATTALSFEMVGTGQALFDITLEYAKHREQFGQPIGSFQAIQHKFADLFIDLEKARSTAYFAAMTLAEHDPRSELAASMAKAAIGECQRHLAKEGIQIHGGLGYTWEQDVHLYVKRLKTGEALFGTTGFHRQKIAEKLGL